MRMVMTILTMLLVQGSACVSLEGERSSGIHEPLVNDDMQLEEALTVGTTTGGPELARLQHLIGKRRAWPKAHAWLETHILSSLESEPDRKRLINSLRLYLSAKPAPSVKVFTRLLASPSREIAGFGWLLAANRPQAGFRSAAVQELANSIESGRETRHLCGEMARAAQALRLEGFYSLLRLGLMVDGHPAFAEGMIAEDPQAAARDFLAYLSMAPLEELRQLNLISLQLPTCLVVMRHLSKEKPDPTHPQFHHIFYFAAARIVPLAELAHAAIETQLPEHAQQLALTISRQPVLVQEAYLTGVRERLNANLRQFLIVLRQVTVREDISGHIAELVEG